ncbi:MAG: hypothetical protein HZA89_07800, partial [Verrucomicrobia bacterium]|nr:hypothetical protein [Verrucomicrobiota bacterium]
MNLDEPATPAVLLGIEGGGTRTVALWADEPGNPLHRAECGPANARLCSDAQLRRRFREIARSGPRPDASCIGLAGAREAADWRRIESIAATVWPGVPCRATNDLETALAAGANLPRKLVAARVLVLSGTGSCCYGRNRAGKTAKIGGWGHILGDKGSGYEIGLRALKAVLYYGDRDGRWPALGARLLRVLQLNEPNELIGWVQRAEKPEVAALATEVFAAWSRRDAIATDILAGAAHSLAKDAAACARRLAAHGARVQFVLAGGVLLKQPRFARLVEKHLLKLWPSAVVTPLSRESAWGAVELAKAMRRETIAAGEHTRPRV